MANLGFCRHLLDDQGCGYTDGNRGDWSCNLVRFSGGGRQAEPDANTDKNRDCEYARRRFPLRTPWPPTGASNHFAELECLHRQTAEGTPQRRLPAGHRATPMMPRYRAGADTGRSVLSAPVRNLGFDLV